MTVAALVVSSQYACARDIAAPPDTVIILGGMSESTSDFAPTHMASAVIAGPRGAVPLEKQVVVFAGNFKPGSIVVRTAERKLYFVLPNGQAIVYPIGVGREGFTWSGRDQISRKAEWPDWRPPAVMIEREARQGNIIPAFMAGGPANPLGARALYIGTTDFRIHGTTQPWSIGRAVSSGCIRMLNAHVIDLYERVSIGAEVIVE